MKYVLIFKLTCLFIINDFYHIIAQNDQFEKIRTIDKSIEKHVPISKSSLSIIFFIEPTCPISKVYMSTIAQLEAFFVAQKINTYYIFPNSFSTKEECKNFMTEYNLKTKWFYDPKHLITNIIKPTITPEVYLFNQKYQIIYHGAIDNLYFGLGKKRKEATEFYLKNALENYKNGRFAITESQEAIGCDIEY